MPAKLPANLKHFRGLKGFLVTDVAGKLGVHYSLISHFESGAKTPSLARLSELAGLYGVTTDQLLGR